MKQVLMSSQHTELYIGEMTPVTSTTMKLQVWKRLVRVKHMESRLSCIKDG